MISTLALSSLGFSPASTVAPPASYELFDYDPVASPEAVVTSGNARFTILTSQLIRMEYAESGTFEDRATLAFVNRKLPVPTFSHAVVDGTLSIETAAVKLSYTVGTAFAAHTLSVGPSAAATKAGSKLSRWAPGASNKGNLLGTIRSLDMLGVEPLNCSVNAKDIVHGEELHCEWGLVSRDGWALVDDSANWGLTAGAEWWDSPNTDGTDWYLFAHGHEYKRAIADYTLVGGKVPVVPRYAMGVWFTRWYDFNNQGVKALVSKFRERSLPLDVYVTDMNWHKKDNWGGWTFDPNLYPYPADTFGWLHAQGLATAANLHDANGVGPYDKMFPQMCAAMGLDAQTAKLVPFSIVNKTYAYALEDIVLGDVADKIDFMWIDWQQGGTQGGAAGGKQNPTIMTNKLRVTDPKRQRGGAAASRKRGVVLARWGGLGSHRYPVGFSGDVADLSWANLAYQPYFSLTAANVAYGAWSHDVEGPGDDPELYTRWVQWAALSGVLRLHERGMSAGGCAGDVPAVRAPKCSNVRPWEVAERFYAPIRAAMVLRAQLVPYLYTAARESFDSGLGLLRPMYYEHPEAAEAYWAAADGSYAQYYLGAELLASPVTAPASNTTRLARRSVWLPPVAGGWYELATGALRPGGRVLTKAYDLGETPLFARAGAVVPSTPFGYGEPLGKAVASVYAPLAFTVYPGAASGRGAAYEDDGLTDAYLAGAWASTTLTYRRTSAATMRITLARNGSFPPAARQAREYRVLLESAPPPTNLSAGVASWSYDGPSLTLQLTTAPTDLANGPLTLDVSLLAVADLSGLKGIFAHANLAKDNLDEARAEPGAHDTRGGALSRLSSVGDALSYEAVHDHKAFAASVAGCRDGLAAAVAELRPLAAGGRSNYSKALLDASNLE